MKKLLFFLLVQLLLISACNNSKKQELPFIGFHDIRANETIHHTIPEFGFLNQDSLLITNQYLSNSIYVVDFFYTYCPSICPKVINQMIRIHDQFENEEKVKLVSFALDPKRDNIENLKLYSENLGVNDKKWHFLTGDKDKIWDLAEEYLISVSSDVNEPGGIFHSGKIMLIDQHGHIRSYADGTDEDAVDQLMNDIELLLKE